jgi:hypothetical protein
MKKILSLAALSLSLSLGASAEPREFRVNPESTSNGIATAWGIEGQSIDFESLDSRPADAEKFMHENYERTSSFLVDLETNSLLATLSQPALYGRLGDSYIPSNHDTLDVFSTDFQKDGEANDGPLVFVIRGGKWSNEISELYQVDRSGGKATVIYQSKDIGDRIEQALLAKATAKERALWVNFHGAPNITISRGGNRYNPLDFSYENLRLIPKKEDPGVTLKGSFDLAWKDGYLTVVAKSVKINRNKQ